MNGDIPEMTHYTRKQLEGVMHAYMVGPKYVHYWGVELYAVPFIVGNQDRLWNMTVKERKDIACKIIEDFRAIGFVVPDPQWRRQYKITQRGHWMASNRYLFTANRLKLFWRKLTGRITRWWAWRGVAVSE